MLRESGTSHIERARRWSLGTAQQADLSKCRPTSEVTLGVCGATHGHWAPLGERSMGRTQSKLASSGLLVHRISVQNNNSNLLAGAYAKSPFRAPNPGEA